MGDLIVTPENPILSADLNQVLTAALVRHGPAVLDPGHEANRHLRLEILRARHEDAFIEDGLATGQAVLVHGKLKLLSGPAAVDVRGRVFEAFVVRMANTSDSRFGRSLFKWVTGRERLRDSIYEPFSAYAVGFADTPHEIRGPQDMQVDVLFAKANERLGRLEPAVVVYSTVPAGVQVKAIRGGEGSAIVDPVLRRQYHRVLTLLRHADGRHSAEVVEAEVLRRLRIGEITHVEAERVRESVARPEQFGLDQREIDDYCEFVDASLKGRADEEDELIWTGTKMQLAAQITGGMGLVDLT